MRTPYRRKDCRRCGKSFQMLAPNQRYCRECWPKRRRAYWRDWRRKERKELKDTWEEVERTDG